jgi:hypothetical protein
MLKITERKKPAVARPQSVYDQDKSTVIQNISEYVQDWKSGQLKSQ